MNKNINDIKGIIDKRLDGICVSGELKEKILSGSAVPKKTVKFMPVMIAACLCLVLAVPVLAATVPGFAALLGIVPPAVGEQLQPVNLICEDNGIKMEVVAAMNDEDTAVIFLTLQDLTDNRIDKSLEMFKYHVEWDGTHLSTSHELVYYDETTDTATVKLSSRIVGDRIDNLNGKKLEVYVDTFLSGKQEFEDFDTGINPAEITDRAETVKLDITSKGRGASSTDLLQELEEQKIINILKPDKLHIPLSGIDFAYISNIGIVDGRLHVQLCKISGTSASSIGGYIALTADSLDVVKNNEYFEVEGESDIHLTRVDISFNADEDGNIIDWKYIDKYEDGEKYYIYEEIIFDASLDILADCKLIGKYFAAYRNYTVCDLRAVFEVDALKESKSADCDIDLGGVRLNKIFVSPFGVIASGSADESYKFNIAVSVTMTDGTVEKFGEATIGNITEPNGDSSNSFTSLLENPNVTSSTKHGNGEFSLKYICKIPLDIERVASVTINSDTVTLE